MATIAGSGLLVAVVGPSGSGKDSLIDYARKRVDPSVLFVRRVVTRRATAAAEDHDTLSPEAFEAAKASGAFAVTWEAHGLSYGISQVAARHVAEGRIAVANGSRAALPAIRSAFARVLVVSITCRPEVLVARLAARGREGGDDIRRRLDRSPATSFERDSLVEIDNSGELSVAGELFVEILQAVTCKAGRS